MGKLTTHVLDTASGQPGAGIPYRLFRIDNKRTLLSSGSTNSDGRASQPLLADKDFARGTYEIEFRVGQYFAAASASADDKPFLDEITLRFTVSKDEHYHVPLLVSPWSYSTYRGS